jgi:hypothetical protein
MRIIETGIELTWDEFHDLTALIRRSKSLAAKKHGVTLSVSKPATPANGGETPRMDAKGWRSPEHRRHVDHAVRKKQPKKSMGRPAITHVRENKSGRCNQHGRQLARDPEDGLWSCPVCLAEADAVEEEVDLLDEEEDLA